MIQLLENLKVVKPHLLEDRLKDMLGDKNRSRKNSLQLNDNNEDQDERLVVTDPVTPRTLKRVGKGKAARDGSEGLESLKIKAEWEKINKEREELRLMREEIERERAALAVNKEDQRKSVSLSARARSESSEKNERLEEVNSKNVLNTARSRNRNPLDAVRESQSEQIDEERGRGRFRKAAPGTKSGTISGTRESIRSN